MNEDEVIEQETDEVIELEKPDDSWEYKPPAVDPMDAMKNEIAELKAMLQNKPELDYTEELTEEISKKVLTQMAPHLDAIHRPAAIQKIVSDVGKGLGNEAKEHIANYLAKQGYPTAQLEYMHKNDPDTLTILRRAAEGVDASSKKESKVRAPISESSHQDVDTIDNDTRRSIESQARAIADEMGIDFNHAKKVVESKYKEAANA